MAFCTNCGSAMDDTSRFCTKCGKSSGAPAATAGAAAAPAPAVAAPGAPPVQKKSGGALKIVLIILAILMIIGMIIAGAVGYGIYRLKKSVHVSQSGDSATIETPFGKVGGGSVSASEAAEQLGVDMYPGADQQGDATSGTFGNIASVNVTLLTSDSVEDVAKYYRERFPKGMSTSTDGKFSLIAGDKVSTLTIAAEAEGGKTKITIAKITNTGKVPDASE